MGIGFQKKIPSSFFLKRESVIEVRCPYFFIFLVLAGASGAGFTLSIRTRNQ